jgi:hypothetical protein
MKHLLPAFVFLALSCGAACAQTSKFDGAWNIALTCPPHSSSDDDARGYTHNFTGQVVGGELSATHKQAGEPGWHFLHGKIREDGEATLRLEGIVNNPKYAINEAPRGKPYTYRVRAHFEENRGSGERLTGRVCSFVFSR